MNSVLTDLINHKNNIVSVFGDIATSITNKGVTPSESVAGYADDIRNISSSSASNISCTNMFYVYWYQAVNSLTKDVSSAYYITPSISPSVSRASDLFYVDTSEANMPKLVCKEDSSMFIILATGVGSNKLNSMNSYAYTEATLVRNGQSSAITSHLNYYDVGLVNTCGVVQLKKDDAILIRGGYHMPSANDTTTNSIIHRVMLHEITSI